MNHAQLAHSSSESDHRVNNQKTRKCSKRLNIFQKKKKPLRLQSHLVAAAETPPLFLDRRRPPSGGAHVRPDVLQPLLQLVVRLTNGGLLFSSCQWIFKKKERNFSLIRIRQVVTAMDSPVMVALIVSLLFVVSGE